MTQTLERMPASGPLIAKAIAGLRRKPAANATITPLEVTVEGVEVEAAKVAAYRDVCGYLPSGELPIAYPQVLATPLMMYLMTQPEFPFPLMGLVHLRNRIEQAAPLPERGRYRVRASIGVGRRIPNGLIFDLTSEYFDEAGRLLTKSVTTPLVRLKADLPKGKMPEPTLPPMTVLESFAVPENTGRRYARAAGDYNPIHLHALTAKLFGFNQPIAHGMWSVARCAAALERELSQPPTLLSVQYRAPLLMPAQVTLKRQSNDKGTDYALYGDAEKLYLSGQIR